MIECHLFSPQVPEPGLEFHMMGFRDHYMHCWLDLQMDVIYKYMNVFKFNTNIAWKCNSIVFVQGI